MGDAGASELAAALDRGALPRLKILALRTAAIGDNGLVALAPALRRLPELNKLILLPRVSVHGRRACRKAGAERGPR